MVVVDLVEHVDGSSLFGGGAEKLRGPLFADVLGDGLGLGELEVTIKEVGYVGEVEAEGIFVLGMPLSGVARQIVAFFGVVDTSVVQDVSQDVAAGASSDVPVAEGGFCLCHSLPIVEIYL